MDHDAHNDDNLMGVMPVYIPLRSRRTATKWYEVPASLAEGEEDPKSKSCKHQKQMPATPRLPSTWMW
eukprot:2898424-Ditylum_brightwellii.AAC.1